MTSGPMTRDDPLSPVGMIRRLRWVMLLVILADILLTLSGQPRSYWTDPSTVRESNALFHYIMSKGYGVSLAVDVFYVGGCFLLVSKLPCRLGAVLLFSLVFGHFFGGASWLLFRYQLGVQSVVYYGIAVSILIVLAAVPPRRARKPAD
ncbi:MAG: hypothetical protein GXX91_14465 [Verrucomicrobiaceae bacterium]|nr:hypothetical protein [Verrucomicrobiaceae bacterium]